MEIKAKENDKYYLFFRPSVSYSTESVNTANRSASSSEGTQLNSSEATTSSSSGKIFTNGGIYAGLKDLGKKHRSVTLGVEYDFYDIDKTSHEVSLIDAAGVKTGKDLFYGSDIRNFDGGIRLSYSEPLADIPRRQTSGMPPTLTAHSMIIILHLSTTGTSTNRVP